ncbi:DUF922 domain-containing protein [Zobellia galactanivorans]|uniref:DUF922 domain-containing protein n=1 Tax=Zobellia galactanivorans (strain DSM 12802 / CCUG 47099 / CIP 106680 / NCIMB 13871 / Dsij) TaxID=63186 RepID=UPI0020911501|nr:DUF922 domain-containing protein [Zobellia galactanivorans]MDO6810190.1 DUF922 domain-containing protein [Zobellia galactanivorans]
MGALKHFVWTVCLLGFGMVFSQEGEVIVWDADRKLQWSDFKGSYFKTEWAAATTASGISYSFTSFTKEGRLYLDFVVQSEFYPKKSWYRPELCDSIILGHEQLHFDISELYARKMRKRLAQTQFTMNAKAEVRAIYKAILKELGNFQNKYDRETNFSRNLEKQVLWNRRIKAALKEEKPSRN